MTEPLKIPYVIDTLDAAPQPLRLFYAEGEDHKFHLLLDGTHPDSAKLAEFRDNNRALVARLKKLDGLDPAEHAALKASAAEHDAQVAAIATERDKHATDLAALAEKFKDVDPEEYRTLKARPDLTTKASELEAALTAEKVAHAKTAFRHAIALPFLTAGGQDTAVDFAVALAEKDFAQDGTTKLFSTKNPGTPLSIGEWIAQQVIVSPFMFKPNTGGSGQMPNTGTPAPKRTISSSDPYAFGLNLEGIASGSISVS